MGCPPGQKKSGRCRQVAVSGGSTVVLMVAKQILIPVVIILGTLTSVQQWQSDYLYPATNRSKTARKLVRPLNLCINLCHRVVWHLGF